jgi:hypothetical protein
MSAQTLVETNSSTTAPALRVCCILQECPLRRYLLFSGRTITMAVDGEQQGCAWCMVWIYFFGFMGC